MHTVHLEDLKALVEAARPASILLIDPNPEGLPPLPGGCQVTRVTPDNLEQLEDIGCFDLGVVANTLEQLERKTAVRLLARLRDLQTRRFVVLVPLGEDLEDQRSHWWTSDLLGYGLSIMARYRVDDRPLYLFHYAIESYKATPQWFNARHWAHPERWKP